MPDEPEQPHAGGTTPGEQPGFIERLNAWLDRRASAFSAVPPIPALGTTAPADEKTWGMLCHLLAMSVYFTGVGHIVGPLVPWLIKRGESPFVDAHGKESLNFQITATLIGLAIGALGMATCGVGFLLAPVALVFWFYVVIRASMKASEGQFVAYPFTMRLIK